MGELKVEQITEFAQKHQLDMAVVPVVTKMDFLLLLGIAIVFVDGVNDERKQGARNEITKLAMKYGVDVDHLFR